MKVQVLYYCDTWRGISTTSLDGYGSKTPRIIRAHTGLSIAPCFPLYKPYGLKFIRKNEMGK